MTVAELIELLKAQPPKIKVVYKVHSEQALLEPRHIQIKDLCHPRNDGWVHDERPDKPTETYLVLP